MVKQSSDRPAELGAGRMAARHNQAWPAVLLCQCAEFSARGEGTHLGSSVHRRRKCGQRFLRVAAVAAGDDEGGRAHPARDAVVVPTGHRHSGDIGEQPRQEAPSNARSTHAEDEDAVVARNVSREGLGGHGGCRVRELIGERSDEVAHDVGNPHEFTAGPTAGEA